jgi:hypothetical protein
MWQWMWAYVTRSRSARLIIGHELPAHDTGLMVAAGARDRPA